jgi:nitrous oxide reductase accessory protein NosL
MTQNGRNDGHDHDHSRRSILAALAGASTLGLAGCAGQQGGDEETTASETTTAEPTTTEAETTAAETTAQDLNSPAEVPEDARCAVCEMKAANFPEWNAQLSTEDDERVHFCTPGCFTAYRADPGHFDDGRTWDQVVGAWVHDYDTKELIDATAAQYALEMDQERIDAPMGMNPLPFETTEAAVAYTEQYDDLTSHDVVGLDAFDVPLARKYRGRFLPVADETAATDLAEIPDDASCAVCGMKPTKFPDWNAAVSFEDGHRAHFCSPGCMTSYYADPGHFEEGRSQETLLGAWAHDYDTKEFVDARLAHWVLETNADRIDAPMKKNPLPFAEEAAATAYVDQYEDLTAEDVIRLADFDRDLATEYRGKFF